MVRIGVTGHRILFFEDEIKSGIQQSLLKIRDSFMEQKWVVYSPLAQGADCMVVEMILERYQAELIVPLPVSPSDYLRDFTTLQARQIFERLLEQAGQTILMPPQPTRAEAYLVAGKYVLENSDVLIAIWDGKAAHGLGGTGDIIHLARERELPIAWIHAGNRHSGSAMLPAQEILVGSVSFERFPDP